MNVAELKILDFIIDHFQCPFMDFLMPKISWFAEYGIFWIVIALLMVISKKYRRTGLMIGVALILGVTLGNAVIKNIVARPRPYDVCFEEFGRTIDLLIKTPYDWSFPSGHSLACLEATTVLMLTEKKFGIPALIISFLVMFSRMYLYVHFLTDVLGGALLGIIFGLTGYFLMKKIYPFLEEKVFDRIFKKA